MLGGVTFSKVTMDVKVCHTLTVDVHHHIDSTKFCFQEFILKFKYISSIFKSGCKEDPNNYHGITVAFCLGKLI